MVSAGLGTLGPAVGSGRLVGSAFGAIGAFVCGRPVGVFVAGDRDGPDGSEDGTGVAKSTVVGSSVVVVVDRPIVRRVALLVVVVVIMSSAGVVERAQVVAAGPVGSPGSLLAGSGVVPVDGTVGVGVASTGRRVVSGAAVGLGRPLSGHEPGPAGVRADVSVTGRSAASVGVGVATTGQTGVPAEDPAGSVAVGIGSNVGAARLGVAPTPTCWSPAAVVQPGSTVPGTIVAVAATYTPGDMHEQRHLPFTESNTNRATKPGPQLHLVCGSTR